MADYQRQGHFPAGSMGPKIEAAIRYLRSGGRKVIITSPEQLLDAVDGKAGTHIVPVRIRDEYGATAMNPKHIIESQQFTVPLLMELFERTRQMEKVVARGGTRDYEQKILATLFYKPSTRTRFSFEAAMLRLGGKVLSTEQAGVFSSAIPGEHLEDTVRVIANDCDVIVLRHDEEGAAARAASVSPVPVINAGEGPGGQHPTQALLDLYTIYDECKTLDGLSVALIGALGKSRTARSLTYLLGKFARVRLYFVAPPQMQISADILAYLERHNVSYELADSPEAILPRVDVVYREAHRPRTGAGRRHRSCPFTTSTPSRWRG